MLFFRSQFRVQFLKNYKCAYASCVPQIEMVFAYELQINIFIIGRRFVKIFFCPNLQTATLFALLIYRTFYIWLKPQPCSSLKRWIAPCEVSFNNFTHYSYLYYIKFISQIKPVLILIGLQTFLHIK